MTYSRRDFGSITIGAAAAVAALPRASYAKGAAGEAEAAGTASAGGITVPEHFVPTPTTISIEGQKFLEMSDAFGSAQPPFDSDDPQAWREYRAKADAGIAMTTKPRAEHYKAKIVEHQLSASTLYDITPDNVAPENEGRAILYIHGGGFMIGGGEAALYSAWQMAGDARIRVYSTDYRLAPEHPFPKPLEDVVEAYRFMLKTHKAAHTAFFGGSAGANLAVAAVLKARDAGLDLPAACAVHSVPSDMTGNGDTEFTNVVVDTILKKRDPRMAANYAGGHDPKDPLLSPAYADYSKGFVPTILTSGTRDILLSGTVRVHRAMVRAGVPAELHVWEAMPHAPFIGSPEEAELYKTHIDFMTEWMTAAGS